MTDSRPNSLTTSLGDLHPIEAFTVPSDAVLKAGCRLEGSFYGSEGYRAARAMFRSGFDLVELGSKATVLWFGPFPRVYVEDPTRSVPFLSSSDMMEARVVPDKRVSVALSKTLDSLIVHTGTLLISRSGTIGNVALCTEDFEGLAVTEHAIRVTAERPSDLGLLYTFLQCEAGQFLIRRSRSGSVVESIYEADVSSLLIPLLPRLLRTRLTELIEEVARLRVEANAQLGAAESEVQIENGLPSLSGLGSYLQSDTLSNASTFTVQTENVCGHDTQFGTVRFDATYYDPRARRLRESILASKGKELRDVLLEVRNSSLRKRNYVDDADVGVPMIGGKQLIQVRPSNVGYLSRALTRNVAKEIVQRGWTLVSCGGTLGRTLFVHRNLEGWTASQHVMRLIPDEAAIWPGYLYAFMASAYGQLQVIQRSYGSVIPEIRDFQFHSIAIAIPTDRGKNIHDKIVRAFDSRADALSREEEAIRLFETAIEEGKQLTEEKWGREY